MQSYLTFPLNIGLAWVAGIGLLSLTIYPPDISFKDLCSSVVTRPADPTDDDRGSGRVAKMPAGHSLWSFRGSGRIDTDQQRPWPVS